MEILCRDKGMRMTLPRRAIARALSSARHPDAEALFEQVRKAIPQVSIATIYRTLRQFEAAGIIERQMFGTRVGHFEPATDHHDHLIDEATGEAIEFSDPELEELQRRIAERLGYRLVRHHLTLFGEKLPLGGATNSPK